MVETLTVNPPQKAECSFSTSTDPTTWGGGGDTSGAPLGGGGGEAIAARVLAVRWLNDAHSRAEVTGPDGVSQIVEAEPMSVDPASPQRVAPTPDTLPAICAIGAGPLVAACTGGFAAFITAAVGATAMMSSVEAARDKTTKAQRLWGVAGAVLTMFGGYVVMVAPCGACLFCAGYFPAAGLLMRLECGGVLAAGTAIAGVFGVVPWW
jgi:hypothetical protein